MKADATTTYLALFFIPLIFVHRNIWCDLSNIISSFLIPNISAYSAHFFNGIDKKKLGHSTVKSFFYFC